DRSAAMSCFGYRRELSKYEDVDEDELLASLSPEELAELEKELVDIDPDANVPIGLRQRDQTDKTPTGTFSREALMKYWESETRTGLLALIFGRGCSYIFGTRTARGRNGYKSRGSSRANRGRQRGRLTPEPLRCSILRELKNALRPVSAERRRAGEEGSRPSTPGRSSHDQLMESIRNSSSRTLKRVEVPHHLR
uniref:Leiomodin 2 (cardiac) b n=1 Tax=Gasterosteus aculeatus TaxID=69293 RepID=G3Q4S6_GASAC